MITNTAGAAVERLSFDAWGKRRTFDWKVYAASAPYPWQGKTITRGYTFHEQLDPVGLIHMNGRVYDPEIGRFLSADIAIQDLSNLQAHNVYTYVNNNPLSFTDPSGFFLSGLFKAIGNVFKSIFKFVGQVFKAILNSQIGRAILQIAACTFGPQACIAAAGSLTLATGGSIGEAVMSMGMTFMSVGTWKVTGGFLEGIVGKSVEGFAEQAVVTGTHAAVGGALSVAQGGSFMEGFASAGLGSVGGFAGEGIAGGGPDGFYVRTAFAASAGGLASEITGGKFANRAITAGFAHMFNAEAHQYAAADEPGATDVGKEQYSFKSSQSTTADCLFQCTTEHFDLNTISIHAETAAALAPITPVPKTWLGFAPRGGGLTTLLSALGAWFPSIDYQFSKRIWGTLSALRLAGRVGARVVVPMAGTSLIIYDVGSIGSCTYQCVSSSRQGSR